MQTSDESLSNRIVCGMRGTFDGDPNAMKDVQPADRQIRAIIPR